MRVYRFETAEGRGPWYSSVKLRGWSTLVRPVQVYNQADTKDRDPSDMPCPNDRCEEGTPMHEQHTTKGVEGMHFGFVSLDQMHKAFPCPMGRAAMHRKGCKLVAFEVPDEAVLTGKSQLVFDRSRAVKVGVCGPKSLRVMAVAA